MYFIFQKINFRSQKTFCKCISVFFVIWFKNTCIGTSETDRKPINRFSIVSCLDLDFDCLGRKSSWLNAVVGPYDMCVCVPVFDSFYVSFTYEIFARAQRASKNLLNKCASDNCMGICHILSVDMWHSIYRLPIFWDRNRASITIVWNGTRSVSLIGTNYI